MYKIQMSQADWNVFDVSLTMMKPTFFIRYEIGFFFIIRKCVTTRVKSFLNRYFLILLFSNPQSVYLIWFVSDLLLVLWWYLMDGRFIPFIQEVFNYWFVMQSYPTFVTFDIEYLKDPKTRERAPVMRLSIGLCLT